MTYSIILILVNLAHHNLSGQEAPHYRAGKVLVFLDNFSDENFTKTKWDLKFPWGPYVSGLAYNRPDENHIFENGKLQIVSRKELYTGEVHAWDSAGNFTPYYQDFDYTTAMLYHKTPVQYGYYECRFKTSGVGGTNAAFWLYGENSTEIDVFEVLGNSSHKAQMTLHWKERDPLSGSTQNATNYYTTGPNFSEEYHTMGVEWDENRIRWFIDTAAFEEGFFDQYIRSRHIPQNPMHVIITQEVGTLDKEVDSLAYPATSYFDYAAFYELKSIERSPKIVAQKPISYAPNQDFKFDFESFLVNDTLNFYPLGHKINVLEGENYIINDSIITPIQNFSDTLYIDIIIDNGIDSSDVFQVKVTPDKTIGITENFAAANSIFYPTPSSNQIYFNTEFEQMEIINSVGKTLYQQDYYTASFNVANFTPGIYYLKVTSKNKIQVQSLVIQ